MAAVFRVGGFDIGECLLEKLDDSSGGLLGTKAVDGVDEAGDSGGCGAQLKANGGLGRLKEILAEGVSVFNQAAWIAHNIDHEAIGIGFEEGDFDAELSQCES